ncbi:protein croquemort-like [Planococcus citri]|uniref:protein croquemort-like n=1 Tax=Planococcus citri TaxID=170843 RepID=UPI0031F7A578
MVSVINKHPYRCGYLIILIGLVVLLAWELLFGYILNSKLVLVKGSQSEHIWKENLVPIYFKVYMFNWTNPEETLAKKQKPNFQEIGPYTFRFSQPKTNIVYNKNHTVTFSSDRLWHFEAKKSKGRLSDRITNINPIAMSVGDRAKSQSFFKKPFISKFLSFMEKEVYVTKTVEELLFEGYDDRILSMATTLKSWGASVDEFLPEKFGWYFDKNASSDVTLYNVNTGTDDLNNLGKVNWFNYKTRCGVYSDRCDQVHGSLGDLWPKNLTKEKIASLYISDFCSSFDLTRMETRRLFWTTGVQFVGTDRTFDNGNKYYQNRCYCKNNKCNYPSGIRDVSDCVHGPIFLSFPHFYLASEQYRRDIKGMHPTAEKHQFSITVQKDSGMVMEIFARLQINVRVEPFSGLGFFSDLPKMMVPTLWFEEYIEMPSSLSWQVRIAFGLAPLLISIIGYGSIIIGIVCLIYGHISYTIRPIPSPSAPSLKKVKS